MADDGPRTPCGRDGCCGPCSCCVKRCCPTESIRQNAEVMGFMYDRVGSTLQFIALLSFLPALAVLAKRDGGCYQGCLNIDQGDDNWYDGPREDYASSGSAACYEDRCELPNWYCDDPGGTVLCAESTSCTVFGGTNPTNIIPSVATMSGVVCALILPFIGAMVDYSRRRWETVAATAVLLVLTNFLQIFLSKTTWFPMIMIQATLGSVSYLSHQLCLFAYIPELTRDPADIPSINTGTKVWETVSIIIFFVLALGVVPSLFEGCGPDKDILTAITGQIIVIVFGVPFLVAGIRLLGRRPALHELPEGDRMATIGFKQVGRTVLTLRQKYRNLFWFFVGYTFWEAATGAVTTLTGAYVIEQLQMSFANVVVLVVLSIIPGALLNLKIMERGVLSLKGSLAGALVLFTIAIISVYLFAYDAQTGKVLYAIAPFVGIANGWITPAQRNLLIAILPAGAEAEMMGFFQFCSLILGWLPPLVFLSLSTASGGDLRLGLLVCPLLWLIGLAVLLVGVDVEKGIDEAAASLHLRNYGGDAAVRIVDAEKTQTDESGLGSPWPHPT